MSKADILSALPSLSAQDRGEILERLWQLEEASGPSESEKAVLNEAQAAYDANPAAGAPWSEVETRLRKRP
jgi:putative addiction module component (TIGR02574 family)